MERCFHKLMLLSTLFKSGEENKSLFVILFWVPLDRGLQEGLPLPYEPVPVKSSAVPSGLFLTESEGNPGEIFAVLGSLDGVELPLEKDKQVTLLTVKNLRWLNRVFDTSVLFTLFPKSLEPLVAKNGSKQVNNTNVNSFIIKLKHVLLPQGVSLLFIFKKCIQNGYLFSCQIS